MAAIDQLRIGNETLLELLEFVGIEDAANDTKHRDVIGWMVLGEGVGRALTGRVLQEPTYLEFTTVALVVELKAPRLRGVFDYLSDCCPFSSMLSVQKLVVTMAPWAHPSQVLGSPRPSMQELWDAYQGRVNDGDKGKEFQAVRDRLESAAALERTAEERRKAWVAGMIDIRVKVGSAGAIARWILAYLTESSRMTKEEIVSALAGVPARLVDDVLSDLGAQSPVSEVPPHFHLPEDSRYESQRQAARLILEGVGDGQMMMSEVARIVRLGGIRTTPQGIPKVSFMKVCGWLLKAVDHPKTPLQIRNSAKTCWDGGAAGA
jgi:hypothetical protein